MSTFTFVTAREGSLIKPGTIMFLPPRDLIPQNSHTDPKLLVRAFNHPVVILSGPEPKPDHVSLNSIVKLAIMTSFNGTSIKKHLLTKGIKHKLGSVVAQRAGYLRVVTACKPHTKDTLRLRNGKGMKRDYSYINVKNTYSVGLKALARYGFGKEEVGAYRLTSHAFKILETKIGRSGRKKAEKV